jgi:hypothetical protein
MVKKLSFLVIMAVALVISADGFAQTYQATATLPAGTGQVSALTGITYVDGGTDVWDTTPSGSLAFGGLTELAGLGIYSTNRYYAMEIAITGGGTPGPGDVVNRNVTFAFNPPATGNSLAWKATAAFANTYPTPGQTTFDPTDTQDDTTIRASKYFLGALPASGTFDLAALPNGGWLRVYFGINTADPASVPPVDNAQLPAGETGVITADDPAGSWGGEIVVSITP